MAPACSTSGSNPVAAGPPIQVQRSEVRPFAQGSTVAPPAAAGRAHGRVLARLQFRDHVLVIRTGATSGDLRYDVQTRAGLLLARSLTRVELGEKFPAIADQFGDSTALTIDASRTTATNRDSASSPPR